MVNFIYLGEVKIHQEDLDGFLLLAQELELKGLTEEDSGTEQKTLALNIRLWNWTE